MRCLRRAAAGRPARQISWWRGCPHQQRRGSALAREARGRENLPAAMRLVPEGPARHQEVLSSSRSVGCCRHADTPRRSNSLHCTPTRNTVHSSRVNPRTGPSGVFESRTQTCSWMRRPRHTRQSVHSRCSSARTQRWGAQAPRPCRTPSPAGRHVSRCQERRARAPSGSLRPEMGVNGCDRQEGARQLTGSTAQAGLRTPAYVETTL